MSVALEACESPLVLRLRPVIELTEDQFFSFCQINEEARIERKADGDLLIRPLKGAETAYRGMEVACELYEWAKGDRTGVALSNVGFLLANKAMRAPDAAWVLKERLRELTRRQKKKFLPLCPDFVVEVRSPSDALEVLKDKMAEYIANGARLGWLIDAPSRDVWVFRPGAEARRLAGRKKVSGAPELAGFVLDLRRIWEPDF